MPYPFSDSVRQALFLILPAVGVLLALLQPFVLRRSEPAARLGFDLALWALVLLGFGLYTNNNWQNRRYFNPYEFFHYYVGSKYAPEVGYTRLYDAAVLVDRETGFEHTLRDVSNLGVGAGTSAPEYKRLGQIYREEAEIRAPFRSERWEEFRRDVVFFRDQLDPAVWERLLHDKGYNAPPSWTLLGGSLAAAVSTEHPRAVWALAFLDPLLLLLGFLVVGWAFGQRAALFAAALYLTHYCTSHAHFRAAFLRTDWLVALLVAVSLLKRGFSAAAGALAAWAALVRVFPVLFVFWAPVQIGWSLWRRRRPERGAVRFLAGFAAMGALVFAVTLLHDGGLETWKAFWLKIAEHDARPASDTVGFRDLFLWTVRFDPSQGEEVRALFAQRAWLWWTCQAGFALALARVLRERVPHEALALCFVLVWCLAAPAYYYYALLVMPIVYCVAEPRRRGRAVGLALLFGSSVFARWLHPGSEMTLAFTFSLSVAFGVVALYLAANAVLERDPESSIPAEAQRP